VERWAAAAAAGGFAPLSSFRAHSSRLECVAVSWDGRFVATASFKGTIVRVFHAADGMLLREVRSSHSLGD
jgi:6-phosphogluconolactonase (cycloisomerase 2 family)